MSDISVGSMKIEDQGDGVAVVMIHGLGGTSNSFQTLISALDGYRVLRPDLPGAGRSSLRPGRPGIAGLATAVQDCLKAAGIAKAHFVGHSMGTIVCQYLAVDHPEMVQSLTLFGPILEPPAAARTGLNERAATATREGMAGIAEAVHKASVSAGKPVAAAFVRESLLRQDANGYAAHCLALSSVEAADLAKITCSTLLIAGETDPVAPVAMAEQMKQKLPRAQLEIIPEVAHWMMMEAPARSAELLRAHLDANSIS
ncbi:alpha/beta fold hydrolase [Sneathiella sp. CAU 1612]|uniref:Alpha/beta fold hydrolase n=1 Tax=Sneathiella sedimenti TaxID=2816034 RepID=A0ABS3F411_9PROT|nr:alpha/beta hydrolase [Sneathiella sedimenti]MBO0333262.1 alpha/beta fold hydrolase [Sneathiella sedimenti]